MSYPVDSWFIRTTAVRDRLVELNRTTKVLDADADATAYAITLWSHSWEGGCGHMYQYNTTVAKEVTGGAVQARDRFGNVERASANG